MKIAKVPMRAATRAAVFMLGEVLFPAAPRTVEREETDTCCGEEGER